MGQAAATSRSIGTRSRSRDNRGFTLTELVVSMAVVGILVSAFVVTQSAMESARVSRAIQDVEVIAHGAAQYAMTTPGGDFAGINAANLENQGLVPSGMLNTGPESPGAGNPWHSIGYWICASGNNDVFCVAIGCVSNDSVNRLIDAFSNRATSSLETCGTAYTTVNLTFDK